MQFNKNKENAQHSTKNVVVSDQYISYARTILKHAPDLSGNVLSGSQPLNVAYRTTLQSPVRKPKSEQLARSEVG